MSTSLCKLSVSHGKSPCKLQCNCCIIAAGISILKNFKYLKVNEDHQKELRSQLALTDEISLHSAIIRLSENANIILEETSTYPSSSFLSDTGGALGLFLGWSILNILRLFGRIYSLMIRITQRLLIFVHRNHI